MPSFPQQATPVQPPTDESFQYVESQFSGGMDATRSPEFLPSGTLQLLVNGLITGAYIPGYGSEVGAPGGFGSPAGGYVQTRPAKQALLSATLPGPIANCIKYRLPNGQQVLLIAVASDFVGSTTGHLYLWNKTLGMPYGSPVVGTAPTQITWLGLFNVYQVQFALLGTYVWVIGATDGNLRRIDLTNLSTNPDIGMPSGYATGELTPTTAPGVTLTNLPLGGANTASTWTFDQYVSPTPLNDILNGSFTSGAFTNWTQTGSCNTDFNVANGDNAWWFRADDAPSYITSAAVTNQTITNSDYTGGAVPTRYCTHFGFSCNWYTDSGGIQDGLTVTLTAYDASSVLIGAQQFVWQPGVVTTIVKLDHVFDFSYLGDGATYVKTFTVIIAPGTHSRPGTNGPYITNIHCIPYLASHYSNTAVTSILLADDPVTAGQVDVYVPSGSNISSNPTMNPLLEEQTNLFFGNFRFSHYLGSTAVSFAGIQVVAIPLTLNVQVLGIRAVLVFRTSTTTTGITSDVMTLAQDAQGNPYLYVDISAIASTLTGIFYVDVLFLSDVALTSPFQSLSILSSTGTVLSGKPAFGIDPLVNAGSKTLDLPYFYRSTEAVNLTNAALTVESGGSPLSQIAQTDGLHQVLRVQLAAPLNTNVTLANNGGYGIYIEGGTFSDGFFRQEVYAPYDPTGSGTANVGSPSDGYFANWHWDSTTSLYRYHDPSANFFNDATWDPVNLVFTDSIPDSSNNLATFLYDHEPPPGSTLTGTAAQAIATFGDRLILAVGSSVWISDLTQGTSAGLYWHGFNVLPLPTDPNYVTEGNVIPVGALEGTTIGDQINRMIVFQSRLVLFFENNLFILSGESNLDWDVVQYNVEKNVGLIAMNAVCATLNSLFFLGPDGFHGFDLVNINRDIGMPIAKLLTPATQFGGVALNPAAFAQCSLIAHAGRIFLNAPTAASGATINASYILDTTVGSKWYQWNLASVLCGDSFAGSTDTNDLVVGCADGMLYSLFGNVYGDTSVANGTVSPVTLYFKTRMYLGGANDLLAQRFGATWECDDAQYVATIGVYDGDQPTKKFWKLAYNCTKPVIILPDETKVRETAYGPRLYVDWTATTVNPVTFRKSQLRCGRGKVV